MDWTIYSYHNVAALRGILNAIAAVTGAGDYRASVFVVVFFGFFSAALAYALAPQKMQGWQWLASVVLVYTVLFVPKSTVQLVDVTADEAPAVVANVPLGLAVLAGASSQVGHTLTGLMETAFSSVPGTSALPEDLSYQHNGMMFGARMVKMSQDITFRSASLRSDMTDFFSNCVEPELDSGAIPTDQFMKSTSIWAMLDGQMNPARFTTVSDEPDMLMACDDAYAILSDRIDAEKPNLLSYIAYQAHPTMDGAAATSRVDGEISAAYAAGKLAAASATAGDIVAQNAVINAIHDGSLLSFVRSGDTTGFLMNQAQSQTFHQKNSAFISNAKIAEQALPVVRNVIEAVAYALFPLMVLLLFLSSGRETVTAFRNYAVVLIWIQLWPPLYAVLNYMASIYASYDMAAAAAIDPASGARGVALATYGAINDNALSCQAVVGYLTFSVPFLAWAALKRMENFGTTVAGALNGLQATGDANASSASMGNMSWGQVSRNQANISPLMTNPGVHRNQGDDGTTHTYDAFGNHTFQMLTNSGPVDQKLKVNLSAQHTRDLSHSKDIAEAQRKSAGEAWNATLSQYYSHGFGIGNSNRASQGTGWQMSQAATESFKKLDSYLSGVAKHLGLADTAQMREALGVLLLGNGAAYNGGTGVQDAMSKARNAMEQKEHSVARGFTKQLHEEAAAEIATLKSEESKRGQDSSLVHAATRSVQADTSYQEAVRLVEDDKRSGGAEVWATIDAGTVDPHAAEQQLNWRTMGVRGLSELAARLPAQLSQHWNLDGLTPNMTSPTLKPTATFSLNGTPVDADSNFKQVHNDSHPEAVDTSEADAKAMQALHQGQVANIAAQGGPNANNLGHVAGSTAPGSGDGRIGEGFTMQQIGNADGTLVSTKDENGNVVGPKAAGDLGNIPEEVRQKRENLDKQFDARDQKAQDYIPGYGKNADGTTSVSSPTMGVVGKYVVKPAKGGYHANEQAAEHADDRAMALLLAAEKGSVTNKSLQDALGEVNTLKQAAAHGDEDAAAKLKEIRPLISYSHGERHGLIFNVPHLSPSQFGKTVDAMKAVDWSDFATTTLAQVKALVPDIGSSVAQSMASRAGDGSFETAPRSPDPIPTSASTSAPAGATEPPAVPAKSLADSVRESNPGASDLQLMHKTAEALRGQALSDMAAAARDGVTLHAAVNTQALHILGSAVGLGNEPHQQKKANAKPDADLPLKGNDPSPPSDRH